MAFSKSSNAEQFEHIVHPIPPFYKNDSEILILGSFPSVKSREQNFFYGHPQNRFWKVLATIFDEKTPDTMEEKHQFLQKHRIALWDTILSCDIIASSDSSIKNVEPTNLEPVIENSKIKRIFCNGKTAAKYYEKFHQDKLQIIATVLPSTSPANVAFSFENLVEAWSKEIF